MGRLCPQLLPDGLEVRVEGASCLRWTGGFVFCALILSQLAVELDLIGGANDQEPPALLYGSPHPRSMRAPPSARWCAAARGGADGQLHACAPISHQAIAEEDGGGALPWATQHSLLATLRGGVRRLDLDVFATKGGAAGHSLLVAHPTRLQSALGLPRPPMQHTAAEISAAAERKLWPPPLTLKELLAWIGGPGPGLQVESITLEPKQDGALPEFVFEKLLDDVAAAPGMDSRTTLILRSQSAISAAAARRQHGGSFTEAELLAGAFKEPDPLAAGPKYALSIRDIRPDGTPVTPAGALNHARKAIEHANEMTRGPRYRVIMPSAKLLLAAPKEAAELVAVAHAAGVEVLTWTVDDDASLSPLMDLALDGIVSNRPFALGAQIAERLARCGT